MQTPIIEPNALIIGASRGLGLALTEEYLKRGWKVTATIRGANSSNLPTLAKRYGGRLVVETVDINDEEGLASLHQRLRGQTFDLLFVNAGVTNDPQERIGEVSTEEFVRVMVTNALSPMRVIERFADLVPAKGTLGVMSSILGSVAENETGGWEVYRGSKAALNTLMRSFAARHRGGQTLLVIAPGWVRTDMGGSGADLSIEESIPRVVDTIVAQSGRPGLQYLDYQGKTLRW